MKPLLDEPAAHERAAAVAGIVSLEDLSLDEVDAAMATLRGQQRFPLAIATGLLAAVLGTAAWVVLAVVADLWTAGVAGTGVAALVGWSVRTAGRGRDERFGILGAAFSLLGLVSGMVLESTALLARLNDERFGDLVQELDAGRAFALLFGPLDLLRILIVAATVTIGFRLAFRPIRPADIRATARPRASLPPAVVRLPTPKDERE